MPATIHDLLRAINTEARQTAVFTGRREFAPQVMAALAAVPRERFVGEELRVLAYIDGPLSIGHGQTISQPYIVALMTDLLDLSVDDVVLEIGTGSGYQTAVLCELVQQVYSVERLPQLHAQASARLHALGYDNVTTRCANGYLGWSEKSPFDAIIVTAAAPQVPPALLAQLKPGGRLVIPVGPQYGHQELMRISKNAAGETHSERMLSVAFVPLIDDTANEIAPP